MTHRRFACSSSPSTQVLLGMAAAALDSTACMLYRAPGAVKAGHSKYAPRQSWRRGRTRHPFGSSPAPAQVQLTALPSRRPCGPLSASLQAQQGQRRARQPSHLQPGTKSGRVLQGSWARLRCERSSRHWWWARVQQGCSVYSPSGFVLMSRIDI